MTTPTPSQAFSRHIAKRARPRGWLLRIWGWDDLLLGNRRGPLPLRWVYRHMLRELAQHCGHADILREQILGECERALPPRLVTS
ncbi:mycothiol transferase [Paenarthrobacter ureafaciens]|uniref:mycothiol transferase n=1 Tax=Paenarthrobacter ureafaciens TaxID=37931 RepID=UPI0034640D26